MIAFKDRLNDNVLIDDGISLIINNNVASLTNVVKSQSEVPTLIVIAFAEFIKFFHRT